MHRKIREEMKELVVPVDPNDVYRREGITSFRRHYSTGGGRGARWAALSSTRPTRWPVLLSMAVEWFKAVTLCESFCGARPVQRCSGRATPG